MMKKPNQNQESPASSRAQTPVLKDTEVLCTSKINLENVKIQSRDTFKVKNHI